VRDLVSNLWAALILLLGPLVGVVGGQKVRSAMPRRKIVYLSNAVNLLVIGSITVVIDLSRGHSAFGLLALDYSARAILICSICLAVVCIALVAVVIVARSWLHRPPNQAVVALLPRSLAEKIAFVVLCLLIALVEEFIYRGFVLTVAREWLASDIIAVGLVSLSFALMHGLQDFIAITSAFIQGILLSLPVLVLHSLVPSIVAHFAVDVFARLCMLMLLRRLGALRTGEESSAMIAKS
jgi:membrane protease YdiL (CAAX protease family)